jgi:transcriptional regulator with XRE-family HTH domain
MLTELGRFLRKLRIDRGELIKDMAGKLGVTASYLSAIEVGKRKMPPPWTARLAELYGLDDAAETALRDAAARSAKVIPLDMTGADGDKKDVAILFAREFETMDDALLAQIRDLLKRNTQKDEPSDL